jgi:hypothetical protein
MPTQREISSSIVAQLRLLDPDVSAEVGTPERKIIDVVSQQIAERSIDLNQLEGAADLTSKYGSDLDNFIGMFGIGRSSGTYATSFVTFSRETPSTYDIPIPVNTVVRTGRLQIDEGLSELLFQTTSYAVLQAGSTSVEVPVRCSVVGAIGNVAIGQITRFGPSTIPGISQIRNNVVGINGVDPETDDQVKIRFKNTVFRNVAGTIDQYLALAISLPYATRANVVGPISRFTEHMQVPLVDDSNGGAGVRDEWTSAPSIIPYSKHVYSTIPHYVVDPNPKGLDGITFGSQYTQDAANKAYFYRPGIDFEMNVEEFTKGRGDTIRQRATGEEFKYRPNLTFKSVVEGKQPGSALRPGQVVVFEHSYMSSASRNDYERGILNCVDVFINGDNKTAATTVLPIPTGADAFVNNPASIRHFNNYRRYGEPNHLPVLNNYFVPLFWQPVSEWPTSIVVDGNTFKKDVHFWPIVDVTELGGTTRARNGLEWSSRIPSENGNKTLSEILESESSTNAKVLEITYAYNRNIVDLQVQLETNKQVVTDVLAHEAKMRYFKFDFAIMYNRGADPDFANDVISRAIRNHFESLSFGSVIQISDLIQVIYNSGAIDNIRWSYDLLRSSRRDNQSDTQFPVDETGNPRWPVTECDRQGEPLARAVIDRIQEGRSPSDSLSGSFVRDRVYLASNPVGGTFALTYVNDLDMKNPVHVVNGETISMQFAYNSTASQIQDSLNREAEVRDSEELYCYVVGEGTPEEPWIITWNQNKPQEMLRTSSNMWGDNVFDTDFYLQDDELPTIPVAALDTDSAPGLIARIKAQNTWDQR